MDTSAFESGSSHASKLLKRTQRDFDQMGKKFQRVGASMSTWITLPILGAGAGIIKMAGDFESGMNRVSISTQATAKEMAEMRELALDIGAKTTKSASESADAMDMLAKAGLSAKDILGGAARAAVALAEAAGSELDPAAAAITDTMGQFGKTTADLPNIINNITGAVNQSKFDFSDFQLGMAQAGGVAASAGVEFEDFTATLAATSSQFASGSDAGTSFKTFLMRMVPDTKKARVAMEEYGVSFFDANGQMKSMAAVAQMLQDKFAGMSEQDRTAIFKTMFGTDAIRTAIGLMKQGAAGIEEMQAKIAKTDAAKQAAERMKGFNAEMRKFSGSIETLAIRIGESGLLSSVASLIASFTRLVEWMSKTSPATLKVVTAVAGVAAAMGPLSLVFGTSLRVIRVLLPLLVRLGPVFTVLVPIIGAVTKALALMALTPIGAVIIGITAAVVAGYLAWKNWDKIVVIVQRVYTAVKTWLLDKLGPTINSVKTMVMGMITPFRMLYNAVVGHSYIPDMVDEIAAQMARLDAVMVKPAKDAAAKTTEAFRKLAEDVKPLLDRLFPEAAALRQMMEDLSLIDRGEKGGALSATIAEEARRRRKGEGVDDALPVSLGSVDDLLEESVAPVYKLWADALERWVVKPAKDGTAQVIESFSGMAQGVVGSLRDMVASFKHGDLMSGVDAMLETIGRVVELLRSIGAIKGAPVAAPVGGARAMGGPVVPGRQYLVGERGPEWFSPGSRGFITPGANDNARPVRVMIAPSPYFNAVVDNRSARVAGPMAAQAAALGGISGEQRVMRRQQRMLA